jgi:hypothetical protein
LHQPEYSDANKSARSRAQQFGLTKAWIQEKLGVLLHYYGLNGEIDHKLSYVSLGHREKTPPRYVQQPEANEEQPVTYHARSHRTPMEALNGHKQSKGNVAIARAERHDAAGAGRRATEQPAEKE